MLLLKNLLFMLLVPGTAGVLIYAFHAARKGPVDKPGRGSSDERN